MKNKKTFIGLIVLLAVLMLGIGYAALTNITLNINGTATGIPDGSNFVVDFSDDESKIVVDKSKANTNVVVDAKKTGTLKAKLDVSNLTSKGESVTVTYTIENNSKDLNADLELSPASFKDDNFEITAVLADDSIAKGESTTVTVTATLLVTPVTEDVSTSFNFSVEASPVQP